MLISYKWLSEYLDLKQVSPNELAEKMSRTGIEVEDVIVPEEGLKKIVVGLVERCIPHPNSDHLSICQVNIGESELSQIVCGAPNVAAGKKVIVALPGARITGNAKIKKGKMRGEVSNGMLCSLQELGFSDSVIPKEYANGIYFMPEEAVVGSDVFPYLWMNDAIIELSITPNRADALSMRGTAYEVGAIYRQTPHFIEKKIEEDPSDTISNYVRVELEDPKDTLSYQMRIIKDVTISESPLWLQRKLMNAGIRPISNVVDVTNYVLLEFGQPLHAFDYQKINSKEILVRRGKTGEMLTTLDGEERQLSQDNIVVTNGTKPIALAGVMGGLDSEIDEKTTCVALEAAVFDGLSIRKTSKEFNLRSESSSRFEKGINLSTVEEACDYAAAMIAELSGGTIVSGKASSGDLDVPEVFVDITLEKINRTLGTSLTIEQVSEIFDALGFGWSEEEGQFTVSVPPRRWDISIQADIMEEVARIFGYDNLPSTLPTGAALPATLSEKQMLRRQIKLVLEGAGLTEAVSYALTTPEKSKQFVLSNKEKYVPLQSPMSEDHSVLRMNLVSGLLEDIAYNVARKNPNVSLYEVGRVFYQGNVESGLPVEENHIAFAITGLQSEKEWYGPKQAVDFYLIKGMLENVLEACGILDQIQFRQTSERTELHPGRSAEILVGEVVIGFIGQVHPNLAKEYRVPETYTCVLQFDKLFELRQTTVVYQPISKLPSVQRDVAMVVPEKVSNQDLVATIKNNGGKFLKDVHLFDLYQGEKIEADKKSLAFTLTFENPNETLTDEEIAQRMAKIETALHQENQALIR